MWRLRQASCIMPTIPHPLLARRKPHCRRHTYRHRPLTQLQYYTHVAHAKKARIRSRRRPPLVFRAPLHLLRRRLTRHRHPRRRVASQAQHQTRNNSHRRQLFHHGSAYSSAVLQWVLCLRLSANLPHRRLRDCLRRHLRAPAACEAKVTLACQCVRVSMIFSFRDMQLRLQRSRLASAQSRLRGSRRVGAEMPECHSVSMPTMT